MYLLSNLYRDRLQKMDAFDRKRTCSIEQMCYHWKTLFQVRRQQGVMATFGRTVELII